VFGTVDILPSVGTHARSVHARIQADIGTDGGVGTVRARAAVPVRILPFGDDLPWAETIRRRTIRVGAGREHETLSRGKTPQVVPPSDTLTVSIDAGHVRTARGHQGRTFEVMAAQLSNADGKPVLFSGVPGETDRQHTQLNGVLSGLGMTADTEVTILSDGTNGPRSLGEAASTGTVFHVLD